MIRHFLDHKSDTYLASKRDGHSCLSLTHIFTNVSPGFTHCQAKYAGILVWFWLGMGCVQGMRCDADRGWSVECSGRSWWGTE
jgi:hypothetical protein